MQSMQGKVVKAYVKDTAHLSPSDQVFTVNIDNTLSNPWDHTDSKTSLKFSLLGFSSVVIFPPLFKIACDPAVLFNMSGSLC